MASKFLTQLDIQPVTNLINPVTGFIGFGSKSDGLYQKVGTVESKLLTAINSGMVTTALGYTPWHSGNHPTTISGYGITDIPTYSGSNFILNQNYSAQSANMWISGDIIAHNKGKFGITYHSIELGGGLPSDYGSAMYLYADGGSDQRVYKIANKYSGSGTDLVIDYSDARAYNTEAVAHTYTERFRLSKTGAATFASTVTATQLQSTVATGAPLTVNSTTMVGNLNAQYWSGRELNYAVWTDNSGGEVGGLLGAHNTYNGVVVKWDAGSISGWLGLNSISKQSTSGLSTNYIPKWNGSSMVNSVIMDDGNYLGLGLFRVYYNNTNIELQSFNKDLSLNPQGNIVRIPSTYASTAPTNGALVVGGGIGVGGNGYFNGNIGIGGDSGLSNPRLILNTTSYRWLTQCVGGNYQINVDGVAGSVLSITASNGNTGIGYNTDQGYKLAVNGNIKGDNYIGKSNGFYTVQITQAAYNALGTKDASTIYMIVG